MEIAVKELRQDIFNYLEDTIKKYHKNLKILSIASLNLKINVILISQF